MALFQDIHWPRASGLLTPGVDGMPDVTVVGVPWHLGSLTAGRCDLAPAALRAALARFACYDVEHGIDLQGLSIFDCGDFEVAALRPQAGFSTVVALLRQLPPAREVMLALGGDNSITRPLVHAVSLSSSTAATSITISAATSAAGSALSSAPAASADLVNTGLITLDAHFDLREISHGLTNGNPLSALLDDGLPGENIVQIGIQSFSNSAHYAQVAAEAGMHCITVERVRREGMAVAIACALDALASLPRIVVDIDLDVLDRVWMPAAPGARPGGLTLLELAEAVFLLGREPRVIAADIVELDPACDQGGMAVMSGGRILLSFLAGICSRRHGSAATRPAGGA